MDICYYFRIKGVSKDKRRRLKFSHHLYKVSWFLLFFVISTLTFGGKVFWTIHCSLKSIIEWDIDLYEWCICVNDWFEWFVRISECAICVRNHSFAYVCVMHLHEWWLERSATSLIAMGATSRIQPSIYSDPKMGWCKMEQSATSWEITVGATSWIHLHSDSFCSPAGMR